MKTHRRMIIGGAIVAVIVSLLAVVDLLFSKPFQPFGGQIVFDICALFASIMTLYMAYEAWSELIGQPLFETQQRTGRRDTRRSERSRTPVMAGRTAGHRNSATGTRA